MARILADCGNTAVKLGFGRERLRLSVPEAVAWLRAQVADELVLLPTARHAADALRAAWSGRVRTVGADLVVPAVGQYPGMGLYRIVAGFAAPHPGIVVDAGTATTLTAWNASGQVAGGLILPSPHAMIAGLHACAPALPVVEPLGHAARAAQQATAGAIAAAAGIGHPAMVQACLERLRTETGIGSSVLTGGGAVELAAVLGLPVLPWLVLEGMERLS
jgi:pantothenate kinase type III